MTEEKQVKAEAAEKVFGLVQVSTQNETMIQTPDGKVMDIQSGIAMLLNKMDRIEKLVG